MSGPIYLDYAATTPLAPEVYAAMQPYLGEKFYNPSAQYAAAREVARDLEVARARVAHWLGARPSEVIFTAGGTEANNLALKGLLAQYPDGNLVTSVVEHEAMLAPSGQFAHRLAPVTPDGTVDLQALAAAIDDQTVLVSIMYANNELGTIQPLRKIAQLIASVRAARQNKRSDRPIYLHTDASQAAAYLDLHASRLGVDLMTINGSKIYGPKQVGALFVKSGIVLQPQVLGGGQERGMRSGTENVAGVIGLAAALDLVQSRRHEEVRRLQELQRQCIALLEKDIPGLRLNGSLKHRLPNNVHVTIPGQDNERLMILLDEQGILCAAGSACSASSGEPSHVLTAIGLSDEEARASLRFTMGRETTKQQIDLTVAALKRSLEK